MKTIKIILLLLLISNSLIAQKINIDITFYTKNLGPYHIQEEACDDGCC